MSRAIWNARVRRAGVASVAAIGWLSLSLPASLPAQGVVAAASAESVSAPSEFDLARRQANDSGHRVEIVSSRTATSTTWANADGSLTTDTTRTPTRVDMNGQWVPLDLGLVRTPAGWAPKASPVDVVFSAGGTGPAVQLADQSSSVALDWTSDLPEPSITGATATYRLSETEDLVLRALDSGVEQLLVLKERPETPPTIRLPMSLANLRMRPADTDRELGGLYEFVDEAGSVAFSMPVPHMWDAQVDEVGSPTNRKPIAAQLANTPDGPALDLAPSLGWLQASSTKYPVVIDPVIATLRRGGDSYIKDTDPVGSGGVHNSDNNLGIGYNGSSKMRAILQFEPDSDLEARQVLSASLNLYNYAAFDCTPRTVNAYPVTSSFSWSGLAWDSQPTVDTSSTYASSASFSHGVSGGGCPAAADSVDVTKIVKAWQAGTLARHYIELRASETVSGYRKYFCSMTIGASPCDSATRQPTLSVTYNTGPSAPTDVRLPEWLDDAAGTGVTTSTPSICAKPQDMDGGSASIAVEVWNAGHTTRLASGTSASAPVNTSVCWSVPSGSSLVDGSYAVRVATVDGSSTSAFTPWIAMPVLTAGLYTFSTDDTTSPDGPSGPTTTGVLPSQSSFDHPTQTQVAAPSARLEDTYGVDSAALPNTFAPEYLVDEPQPDDSEVTANPTTPYSDPPATQDSLSAPPTIDGSGQPLADDSFSSPSLQSTYPFSQAGTWDASQAYQFAATNAPSGPIPGDPRLTPSETGVRACTGGDTCVNGSETFDVTNTGEPSWEVGVTEGGTDTDSDPQAVTTVEQAEADALMGTGSGGSGASITSHCGDRNTVDEWFTYINRYRACYSQGFVSGVRNRNWPYEWHSYVRWNQHLVIGGKDKQRRVDANIRIQPISYYLSTAAQYRFNVQVHCGSVAGKACRNTQNFSNRTVSLTAADWERRGRVMYSWGNRTQDATGTQKLAYGSLQSNVRIVLADGSVTGQFSHSAGFRCDSDPRAVFANAGRPSGCVFLAPTPFIQFSRSDPAVDWSAWHIARAWSQQPPTWPAGNWYNSIPGNYDLKNLLTRTTSAATQNANRAASKAVCRQVFGANYTSSSPGERRDCDEFPFASTSDGAALGNGRFSAYPIPHTDNITSGARLGTFYTRDRILNGDRFAVRIVR